MKWLILIILVSCGKHEEPKAIDIKDDDGDQILNYQEAAISKYIANIDHLGIVKGIIRFNTDRFIELPFSNILNIQDKAKELMVINDNKYHADEYFIEWSRLNIDYKNNQFPQLRERYDVELKFDNDSEAFDELFLSLGESAFSLGKWNSSIRFQLSAMHFNLLINGKAHLKIKKKTGKSNSFKDTSKESIRNRTYRVYYSNGEESKTLYVANELNLEALAEMMDIQHSEPVESEDIFFFGSDQQPRWFRRQLANGDAVLVKSNFNELQKYLLKNYSYQKTVVSRLNGVPLKSHRLKSSMGGKTFVKIKPLEQTVRSFKEYIKNESHRVSSKPRTAGELKIEITVKCNHYFRAIKEEKIFVPGHSALLNNLLLMSNGDVQQLDQSLIKETYDKEGHFWEIYLINTPENLEINVASLEEETFVLTGEFKNSCQWLPSDKRAPTGRTNKEGKLSFEVESYVEKI